MIGSALAKKFNPLSPPLSSQFLQRCSVSKTAKGKGKIKAGQQLKRNKVTTKKGSAASEGGPKKRSENDELIALCRTATSPLRHLKPKEKAREAEREKMGLISAANKQAKENLKKYHEKFKDPIPMGPPGLDYITLGVVDADKIPKYELTVEDGRRLAKAYSSFLMKKHRARQAAESKFLKLKNEAIAALPEDLRAAALVPDDAPAPRFLLTLTPPIEGYMDKLNEASRESEMKITRRR